MEIFNLLPSQAERILPFKSKFMIDMNHLNKIIKSSTDHPIFPFPASLYKPSHVISDGWKGEDRKHVCWTLWSSSHLPLAKWWGNWIWCRKFSAPSHPYQLEWWQTWRRMWNHTFLLQAIPSLSPRTSWLGAWVPFLLQVHPSAHSSTIV